MKKLKDIFWLLFFGIIGGVFFVGCILCFGWGINFIGKNFTFVSSPFLAPLMKIIFTALLAGVIFGAVRIISNVWNRFSKGYWEEIPFLFSQEEREIMASHPLTAAILKKNDWDLSKCMGPRREEWAKKANEVIIDGRTALHIAAILGAKSSCETLLYHQANPFCKDKYGRTPLDYALEHRHENIIKLLKKAIQKRNGKS